MQALYRRYRPKTFDEVVGQEMTITALKNQIKEGRVHHVGGENFCPCRELPFARGRQSLQRMQGLPGHFRRELV